MTYAVIVQNLLIVSCFLLYLLNQDLTKVHKLDSDKVHTLQYLIFLLGLSVVSFSPHCQFAYGKKIPESFALYCLSTAHLVD